MAQPTSPMVTSSLDGDDAGGLVDADLDADAADLPERRHLLGLAVATQVAAADGLAARTAEPGAHDGAPVVGSPSDAHAPVLFVDLVAVGRRCASCAQATSCWRASAAARLMARPMSVVVRLAPGRAVVGHRAGIALDELYLLERHAHLAGGDLRQHGRRSLAHLRGAGHDRDRAIGVDAHDRRRDRLRAGIRRGDADGLAAPGDSGCVPVQLFGGQVDVGGQVGVDATGLGPGAFARREDVALPDLERVEPQPLGGLVHLRLTRRSVTCGAPKPRNELAGAVFV